MNRLSRYLARLFAADAMALFAVALFLLFLIQCLRSFDVVSSMGQDLLTLFGQALLSMPTLGIVFLYVCLAIGLARGLKGLQDSSELQVIHASRRLPALLGGVAIYTGLGALAVFALTHFVEPTTNRQFNNWQASIAADLVGRALVPHRFVEVVPDVTIVIGGRGAGGELSDFFADDDRTADMRRTYQARAATVAMDDQGYVLQLRDGSIQYMTDDLEFSRISFDRYDIALERLTGPATYRESYSELNSLELVLQALGRGTWDTETLRQLGKRLAESIRVIALCLAVAAMAMFPHGGRNRHEFPIEIIVLGLCFLERGVSSYLAPTAFLPVSGSLIIGGISLVVLLVRLQAFRPLALKGSAA
jgi:lipopolysaccharide export system permease protein